MNSDISSFLCHFWTYIKNIKLADKNILLVNFYFITFSLQNKRDNFELLTEIFTYELAVIERSKGKKRPNYLQFWYASIDKWFNSGQGPALLAQNHDNSESPIQPTFFNFLYHFKPKSWYFTMLCIVSTVNVVRVYKTMQHGTSI